MSWNLFFCLCVSKSDTFDWSLYPFKTICAFIGCESLLSGKSCFGVLLQTERKVQPMWLNQSRAASSNKHSGKWKFFIQEQKTNLSTCLHILHSFNWIQMFQLAIVLLAYRFESKSWTEKGTWMSVFLFFYLACMDFMTEINCTHLCNAGDHVLHDLRKIWEWLRMKTQVIF